MFGGRHVFRFDHPTELPPFAPGLESYTDAKEASDSVDWAFAQSEFNSAVARLKAAASDLSTQIACIEEKVGTEEILKSQVYTLFFMVCTVLQLLM